MSQLIINALRTLNVHFMIWLSPHTQPRKASNFPAYYAYAMLFTSHRPKSQALTLTLLCICLGQVPYSVLWLAAICYLMVTWSATWLGLKLGLRPSSHLVCRLVEQWAELLFLGYLRIPFMGVVYFGKKAYI